MRVLHVLESFAAGGMETTFLHALSAMQGFDARNEHHVLAFAGGALEERYRARAASVRIDPACDVAALCRQESIDLVHILFDRCAYRLLPALVAHCDVPVVYGKGYDLAGMYRLNEGFDWPVDASLLAAADGVTFTTAVLEAGYALPSGRTNVLGKAADVARFTELAMPATDAAPHVACVANLHPRKRLGDLIDAFVDVRRRVPGATLRFVGGGPVSERDRLMRLAADRGLSDAVSFAGPVDDVAPELARAQIMALPSACEGVPTALLEAMAAGRPVVATRVGHVGSIVDDGVEGWLVDLGDVAALAGRIVTLLTSAGTRARMGAAARQRARTHDVAHVARRQLGALREARQRVVLQAAVSPALRFVSGARAVATKSTPAGPLAATPTPSTESSRSRIQDVREARS
jgi:glycosyltransferase involved in cell wall biosynthesis